MPFDWKHYSEQMPTDTPAASWVDGSDLARLSVQAMLGGNSLIRRDLSQGTIRLAGAGVTGHSAHVDDVANAMRAFQRLVTTSGMALEGHRSLKGAVPIDVANRTQLNLSGSALPGSLVLVLVPATPPGHEILPSGQAEFFHDDESQLVDRAVGNAVELMALAKTLGADADAGPLLERVKANGPRVASALQDFAQKLADAEFATDITWDQPRQPRVRTTMTPPELRLLSAVIASRELAEAPTVISGIVRTVSDIADMRVEVAPGDLVAVDVERIPGTQIQSMHVGQRVTVHATQFEETSPGGDVRTKYRAERVDVIE